METRIVRCCDHCGAELDDDALFCTICGYPVDLWQDRKKQVSVAATTQTKQEYKATRAKKKSWVKNVPISGWKRTAIAIAAIVLMITLSAILISNHFAVLGGPLQRMTTAINHTIQAESFTVDMTSEYGDCTLSTQYNLKDENLLLWMAQTTSNGGTYRTAVCDGYYAWSWDDKIYDAENVQRDINRLFGMYRQSGKLSFEKANWQSILDEIDRDIYRRIARLVDIEQAEQDVQVLCKRMNDTKWMKENAGYSCKWKNGVMTHTLRIDPYTFLMACLECFEDSFYSKSDYYAVQDMIADEYWDEARIDLSLSVKNGKVSTISYADDYEMQTYTFRGIGRTVVDEETVRTFCDKARRS